MAIGNKMPIRPKVIACFFMSSGFSLNVIGEKKEYYDVLFYALSVQKRIYTFIAKSYQTKV